MLATLATRWKRRLKRKFTIMFYRNPVEIVPTLLGVTLLTTVLLLSVSFFTANPEEVPTTVAGRNHSNRVLRRVARFKEECEETPPPDWYSLVQHEVQHLQAESNSDTWDKALVMLPTYTNAPNMTNKVTNDLYLYTAHGIKVLPETLSKPYQVTVIAIVNRLVYCSTNEQDPIQWPGAFCSFDNAVLKSSVHLECLPEHHKRPFQVILLRCQASDRFRRVRIHLANLTDTEFGDDHEIEEFTSKWIDIEYNDKNGTEEATVCIRPLYHQINVLNVLEFIAQYRVSNIFNFVFYYYPYSVEVNKSATASHTARFWNYLSTLPGVELRAFPLASGVDVHAGGQLAIMHDCLFRFAHQVQIHVDLDEFIEAPSLLDRGDLHKMIHRYLHMVESPAVLYIANLMHCHEFNLQNSHYYQFTMAATATGENQTQEHMVNKFYANLSPKTVHAALLVSNNLYSQRTLWNHQTRAKSIVLRPRLIRQLGIHSVWRFWSHKRLVSADLLLQLRKSLLGTVHANQSDPLLTMYKENNIILSHREMLPSEAVMRHFRWCCHLEQGYFFDLFKFYSAEDSVVRNEPNYGNRTRQHAIEQFVLQHFHRFFHIS